MGLARLRIVGALLAIVFAGSPVLATGCELLCARSSAQSHVSHASAHPSSHSSSGSATSAEHARHQAVSGSEKAGHTVLAATSSRDCCDKDAVSSVSVRPSRIITNDFFISDSFATLKTTSHWAGTARVAAPRRGPPAGSSSLATHRLPLRI